MIGKNLAEPKIIFLCKELIYLLCVAYTRPILLFAFLNRKKLISDEIDLISYP